MVGREPLETAIRCHPLIRKQLLFQKGDLQLVRSIGNLPPSCFVLVYVACNAAQHCRFLRTIYVLSYLFFFSLS